MLAPKQGAGIDVLRQAVAQVAREALAMAV
jgi:hypothetical protein